MGGGGGPLPYITWAKKAPKPKHVTLRPTRERKSLLGKVPWRCWVAYDRFWKPVIGFAALIIERSAYNTSRRSRSGNCFVKTSIKKFHQ